METMQETYGSPPKTFYRKARLEDLFGEDIDYDKNTQNNRNQYNHHNDKDTISKHQEEFGQRKRIKP